MEKCDSQVFFLLVCALFSKDKVYQKISVLLSSSFGETKAFFFASGSTNKCSESFLETQKFLQCYLSKTKCKPNIEKLQNDVSLKIKPRAKSQF